MKRYNFRWALALLLTTLILAAACAPTPTPTPIPPIPTPTAKVVEAKATPTPIPTKVPPTPSPAYTPLPTEAIAPTKRAISTKVEAGETVVHYRDETSWDEAQFSWILKHKADFESEGMEKLKKVPGRYEGANYAVEFDEAERSTSLRCEVHGAELHKGYFDFLWLITPLGLDFIGDHFEETTEGLSWKGIIEGIPTEVICEFPPQEVPYAAWADPIGHCHGHVWWTITE